MKTSRLSFIFCTTVLAWASAVVTHAESFKSKPDFSLGSDNADTTHLPVTLVADNVTYDQQARIATAVGHVEITQGDSIVLADKVSYNQATNEIFADGNVSVLESTGNVYFADHMQLKDDLLQGTIAQFRARLSDQSLFASSTAKRLNDHQMELLRAVYSPCSILCDNGESKTPMWQIRADKVVIDTEAETVKYKNAYFEAYGVPVAYTPYLSHATPGADNESGLLAPQYRHSSNIGSVYIVPVYYAIAPDRDATITPMLSSSEGLIMTAEYRQLFDTGQFDFRSSATNPQDRDAAGNRIAGNTFRGHVFSKGEFHFADDWNWGFDINRATDDTYLRRYQFSEDTLLTSKIYTHGIDFLNTGRLSYASVEAISFQGLTATDDLKHTPFVAPLAAFDYQSELLAYGSRFSLTGSVMSLMRQEGADSRRLSFTGDWSVPYISEGGHMFEMASKLRTDIYYVNDVLQPSSRLYDGATGRVVPEATLGWRYPLINRFEHSNFIIEPRVNFALSPRGSNASKIPNEDSASSEFSDLNLFSDNRFPGLDRVETGPRVNYGIRTQWDFNNDRYASLVFGQDYRVINDPLFPLTNDLRSHFSDYVGRLSAHITPVDLSYQFRLDKDGLKPNRQQMDALMTFAKFNLDASYLKLNNDPILGSREEIFGSTSFRLTNQWLISLSARHNLQQNSSVNGGIGLIYKNECITVTTAASRDLTTDRDVQPSTTFHIQVGLKNLE